MHSLLAWLLSTVFGEFMALPDLEDHLATHGVDPALCSQLLQNGWASQNFSVIVDSMAGFTDELWSELSETPLPLVQRSNLKLAWQQVQPEAVPPGHDSPVGASASNVGVPHEGSWAESFAPRSNLAL